jgi:hypothetical protein
MSGTARHESSQGKITHPSESLCRLDVTIPGYVKTHVMQTALQSGLPLRAFVAEVLAHATAFESDHEFLTDQTAK